MASPNRAELARRVGAVHTAELAGRAGSQRLVLDELGPAVAAPDVGKAATAIGDRRTLIDRHDDWGDLTVRIAAMRAALDEGDLTRAGTIAKRYADFDPRDEDLRATVAALLCLGDDPKRGLAMLPMVQNDRATKHHAAMVRNWGEVRAVIVACAARAGVEPPAKPFSEAGRADAEEARAVQRIRLTKGDELREAGLAAIGLLEGAPRTPRGKRALLAAVVASGYPLEAPRLAELCRPREDLSEPPLVPSPVITAVDLLTEPTLLRPIASPDTSARAAAILLDHAEGVAPQTSSPPEKSGGADGLPRKVPARDRLSADAVRTLRAAAGALWLDAGAALARAGDGANAVEAMERGGALALPDDHARALARSSVWYVALDPARALEELDRVAPPPDPGAAPDLTARRVRAAFLVQRAEILAVLGRREEATATAEAADAAAATAEDPGLRARAGWTRVALTTPPAGAEPGAEPAPLVLESALRSDGWWPWVGPVHLRAPGPGDPTNGALGRAFAAWRTMISAPPDTRRALRYVAMRRRGDAPEGLVPYLVLAADLARGEQDPEVWLDAFAVIDARRSSHRAYTWARALAARWRGDAPAAEVWSARYRSLCAVAADPARAEIARYLGI